MKKAQQIFFLLLFSSSIVFGQIDSLLFQKLDSLVLEDQKWRGLIKELNNGKIDTISWEVISANLTYIDSLNFITVEQLFEEFGYLGYDKVGKQGSNNFWLLVQHCDKHPNFQLEVLKAMEIQTRRGNASLADFAYLTDRVKVNLGQLQVYGTQMKLNGSSDSYEPKPVIDPENLNERRKLVDLITIEEYIKLMNERYYGTLKDK